MESVSLDPILLLRIIFLGGIGMSLFLIFVSELKWGTPGLKTIALVFASVISWIRGKIPQRDMGLLHAGQYGIKFIKNVMKMTLVGFAAALLSTTLLWLAFRYGYLIDTSCWFSSCG